MPLADQFAQILENALVAHQIGFFQLPRDAGDRGAALDDELHFRRVLRVRRHDVVAVNIFPCRGQNPGRQHAGTQKDRKRPQDLPGNVPASGLVGIRFGHLILSSCSFLSFCIKRSGTTARCTAPENGPISRAAYPCRYPQPRPGSCKYPPASFAAGIPPSDSGSRPG